MLLNSKHPPKNSEVKICSVYRIYKKCGQNETKKEIHLDSSQRILFRSTGLYRNILKKICPLCRLSFNGPSNVWGGMGGKGVPKLNIDLSIAQ